MHIKKVGIRKCVIRKNDGWVWQKIGAYGVAKQGLMMWRECETGRDDYTEGAISIVRSYHAITCVCCACIYVKDPPTRIILRSHYCTNFKGKINIMRDQPLFSSCYCNTVISYFIMSGSAVIFRWIFAYDVKLNFSHFHILSSPFSLCLDTIMYCKYWNGSGESNSTVHIWIVI